MKKISAYNLEAVVFICGASLMILELVGSRLLAPYVGTSTIVWTSLIGIILGFLSLGYWWGGRLADRRADEKTLSFIIFLSAFFVFLIILINGNVLFLIRSLVSNLYPASVMAAIILFATPSFLLGIVSPYAVKLKTNDIKTCGSAVGSLYAISTLGSIAGTFAAGFLLIPFLGTIKILYLITALLVFSSFLVFFKNSRVKIALIFFFLLCLFLLLSFYSPVKAGNLIDVDTQYGRIWIYPSKDSETSRPILRLTTDPYSVQSAMFLDNDDNLVFKYCKYYRLAEHFNPEVKKGLMIGGAAYSYPKDFLKHYPNGELTVVEIDPGMTTLARKYFNLKDDPRLNIIHEDGRVFLNRNKEKFDAIYIDAFTSRLSIPHQLTTIEAVRRVYESLDDQGVVILNLASSLAGEKSKFLQAELATYQEVFPQVYIFSVDTERIESVQNLILVALKSEKKPKWTSSETETNELLSTLWVREIKVELPVLTDDYAPVDHYIKDLIN